MVLRIRQMVTFQECTLDKNRRTNQLVVTKKRKSCIFFQIFNVFVYGQIYFARTQFSSVPWTLLLTTISDWVFQLTRVMEHGSNVVVNMRDQYRHTSHGPVNKTHNKMWTFVVFCHCYLNMSLFIQEVNQVKTFVSGWICELHVKYMWDLLPVSKAGLLSTDFYKQASFLCLQAFLLSHFLWTPSQLEMCSIFHLGTCCILSVSLGKAICLGGTDRITAVRELLVLFIRVFVLLWLRGSPKLDFKPGYSKRIYKHMWCGDRSVWRSSPLQ